VEKITYNAANKVYVNSQGLLDFIIKDLHVSTEKVSIVGKGSSNGIDATYFSRTPELQKISDDIKMKWNISPGTFVFCFVGRIVRDKGIGELVRAFRRLVESQQNRQYKLLLIGPFESALDPLDADDFRYLNESSDVILAGFQKDVRPWMMAANAFIFPSYREGFPNVVLQASCLELPSIVSDINGCNEIIQHGKTGWVVPVKDANALYDAMVELVGNTDRAQHISRLARQYVVAHFDQQYIWGELLKIYTTMINERQP
jgi:glycosyltransferase involved in cell wall biosynthesis